MHTSPKHPNLTTRRIGRSVGRKLAGAALVALISAAAVPLAHAGLAEDIKAKVNNINTLTGRINKRTADLVGKADEQVQRLDEVGATVNSVIAETDLIKSALAPVGGIDQVMQTVRDLKARFAGAGFDPAELLNSPEVEQAIGMLQQQIEDAQNAANDPDVEDFRSGLISLIQQLKQLSGVDVAIDPFQTFIEQAPTGVMAGLKIAVGDALAPVTDNVSDLMDSITAMNTVQARHTGGTHWSRTVIPAVGGRLLNADGSRVMSAAAGEGFCMPPLDEQEFYVNAYRATKLVNLLKTQLEKIKLKVPKGEVVLGVHGYLNKKLHLGKKSEDWFDHQIATLEGVISSLDLAREASQYCAG